MLMRDNLRKLLFIVGFFIQEVVLIFLELSSVFSFSIDRKHWLEIQDQCLR